MEWLRRIYREYVDPSLKCRRLGHRLRKRIREGYIDPKDWCYVAEKVTEETDVCARCGKELSVRKIQHLRSLNGYSWPSDKADEFQRNGEYWDRTYYA